MLDGLKYLTMTMFFVTIETTEGNSVYWLLPGAFLIYAITAWLSMNYELVKKE